MSDSVSEYTLLIVESPTLAARLQLIAPEYVYVLATGGFLWKPIYDPKSGRLGKKAMPDKLDLRNELRLEAKHAVHIVIATDSDPSGDFIAWTIHKELQSKAIKRAQLAAISKAALSQLLRHAIEIDFSALYKRLQNRYRIRHKWSDHFPGISMQDAGILSVFGNPITLSEFRSKEGHRFFSTQELTVRLNHTQWPAERISGAGWSVASPLSSFDAVAGLRASLGLSSFTVAQSLLQRTFEATHPQTGNGLITYPRTESRSFFNSSWDNLQHQWIKKHSLNEFMPANLREVTDSAAAHDAIRPVHMDVSPDWVERHLPSDIGRVYRFIHSRTLECIRLPEPAVSVFRQTDGDLEFISSSAIKKPSVNLRPFLTMSELGRQLCSLGVIRPSGAGTFFDEAIKKNKIRRLDSGEIKPGESVNKYSERGQSFSVILKNLRLVADKPELNDETIERILSS